jgi:hypothetical protein
MTVQPRDAKVFAALLVSMTVGTMVLMALDNNPPSAGAFCLSSYYHLKSIEKIIESQAVQSSDRWDSIRIYYSGTRAGNIEQLASLYGLTNPGDINCHFVICNGRGGADGQIQPTEKWQMQWSIISDQGHDDTSRTIRICVISDSNKSLPTDFQIKRGEALVEGLRRKFNIQAESIYYPNSW